MNNGNNINKQFSHAEQKHISQLFSDHVGESNIVRCKRNKPSKLDPYLDLIIQKRLDGQSFQGIADFLKRFDGLSGLNRSTVKRRLDNFFQGV